MVGEPLLEIFLSRDAVWVARNADTVPNHSTFSVNRHGRFRDGDIFRKVFERSVRQRMDAGLVKGEGFAVDASVIEADASNPERKPKAMSPTDPMAAWTTRGRNKVNQHIFAGDKVFRRHRVSSGLQDARHAIHTE